LLARPSNSRCTGTVCVNISQWKFAFVILAGVLKHEDKPEAAMAAETSCTGIK
jgi:hypothetical protein